MGGEDTAQLQVDARHPILHQRYQEHDPGKVDDRKFDHKKRCLSAAVLLGISVDQSD
jgi:hypothetical protein